MSATQSEHYLALFREHWPRRHDSLYALKEAEFSLEMARVYAAPSYWFSGENGICYQQKCVSMAAARKRALTSAEAWCCGVQFWKDESKRMFMVYPPHIKGKDY